MIVGDLARRYPEARWLVLSVNLRNHAALVLYRNTGSTGHGGLYHVGRAGPQRVLKRALP